MPRGRPTRDEPTCVLAVRVPVALRDALDRYLDALETRVGLKASRNEIIRHALRLFLETQQQAGAANAAPALARALRTPGSLPSLPCVGAEVARPAVPPG